MTAGTARIVLKYIINAEFIFKPITEREIQTNHGARNGKRDREKLTGFYCSVNSTGSPQDERVKGRRGRGERRGREGEREGKERETVQRATGF